MNGSPLCARGTARVAAGQADGSRGALAAAARTHEVSETHVFLAEELARMARDVDPETKEALAWLLLASIVNESRGATRLPLAPGGPLDAHLAELEALGEVQTAVRALVTRMERQTGGDATPTFLEELLGPPGAYRPLIVVHDADGSHLYHQRMWALETRVTERLRERLHAPAILDDGAARRILADVVATPLRGPKGGAQKLSDEQEAAIAAALTRRLTVITGGPGTGKTSIIVSLLRALARRTDLVLDDVVLTAPTGKAADRMRASVDRALSRLTAPALDDRHLVYARPEPKTLHRLLGFSPRSGRFRFHEHNPLGESFVIVDESSMVDLRLMDRLLAALHPEAQLVLLGDARQLPSVDAGAVFRDLAELDTGVVARLTRSYRMDPKDPAGRNILTLARRIDAGDARGLFAPRGRSKERVRACRFLADVELSHVEHIDPETHRGRSAVLALWAERMVESLPDRAALLTRTYRFEDGAVHPDDEEPLARLMAHHDRARLLAVTRGRATGVEALNEWFHRRATRTLRGPAPAFAVGEPVLVHKNDYDKGLYNGDQGLILFGTGAPHPKPVVVFQRSDRMVAFPLDAVRTLLVLGWALTVHKAQGSEHEHVAIVLPSRDTPVLTRELLYTAVTRASRSVLLIGPRPILDRAIARTQDRHSAIRSRLTR